MAIYLVVFISYLSQAGFSGSRVLVSLYALDQGASPLAVGVIIGLYALCPMLFSIAIGRFADRASPRLPVIAASVAMAAILLLPTLGGGVVVLGIVALGMGFAHQIFSIPIEATVGGMGGPQKRTSNYTMITMAWSLANMTGPLLAGLLIDSIGHVKVFGVLAALIAAPLAVLLALPRLLPKTAPRHAGHDASGSSVADLWRIRPLRTTIIASGVVGTAQDLFQFYMPVYGHAIGLSASAIGTILGMVALAAFVVRIFIPWLVKRLNEVHILTTAVFLGAATFSLMPFFANPYVLGGLAFALGLGVGCAMPLTLSLLYVLTPEGRIAEAIGLHKTVRNATHLVVPLVFGSVGAAFGYYAVFLSNAAMLAGGGWLMRNAEVPATRKK
jgi:MFS family permease